MAITDFDRRFQIQKEFERLVLLRGKDFAITEIKKLALNRAFVPNYNTPSGEDAVFAIDEGNKGTQASLFGLPVWDIIEFRYKKSSGDLSASLNICIIEITQARNIITTAVQGLDGTIKEFISNGDAQITIRATIVGDAPDFYPSNEVMAIQELLEVKDSIEIYSTILNKYFNVDRVVITDYAFSQPETGVRNVQALEIHCLSDNPDIYEIIMKS